MNKLAASLGILGISVGLVAGYWLFHDRLTEVSDQDTGSREPIFYRNPMNPEITSPTPTQDSMGMDYVPVYAEQGDDASPGMVSIDPVVQNSIGLRTAVAVEKSMSRTVRTVGRVDYDEEKLVRLHPKVEGWIRDIRIDKTGQPVLDDDILLSIYSPKLVATQQEYLLALRNLAALQDNSFADIRNGAEALAKSSRERLVLLDVPEHQIRELEQTHKVKEGLHIHAPAGGTVLKVGARRGQFVTPGTELYVIADLSKVWVYADIYEYELPWVKEGDRVEMTLASVPERIFHGELAYIYPYAEATTRSTKVRIVFDNADALLRPEMFAEISIAAAEKTGQIVIPAEAVVRSGDYNQIFVVTLSGTLEPRKVVLGVESGGEVAVDSGVAAGERVVVSAQFLVDSESKLREATAKMLSPGSGNHPPEHDMGTGDANANGRHSVHEDMQHD